MPTAPNGVYYPNQDDTTRLWELMRRQSESVNAIIRVADTAERAQLIQRLEEIGQSPTAEYPLYVHRDNSFHKLEWTDDGIRWRFNPEPRLRTFRKAQNAQELTPGERALLIGGWVTLPGDGGNASGIHYSSGTVTINETGIYEINLNLYIQGNGRAEGELHLNGEIARVTSVSISTADTVAVSYKGPLYSGDRIRFGVWSNRNAGLTIPGDTVPGDNNPNVPRSTWDVEYRYQIPGTSAG